MTTIAAQGFEWEAGEKTPRPGDTTTTVKFKDAFKLGVPSVVVTEACNPKQSVEPKLFPLIESITEKEFVVRHHARQADGPVFGWIAMGPKTPES